jgi:siroheme synthase-like protein
MGRIALFLELEGARVLVVGGGTLAARRAAEMLERGADVHIVAPRLVPDIEQWESDGRVTVESRAFRPEDVSGSCLVLACADDLDVQRACARAAESVGVPCVAADLEAGARASLAAMLRRGALAVAVGTGGRAPALAGHVRDLLARSIGSHYGDAALLLSEYRRRARDEGVPSDRRRRWAHEALEGGLLDLLERGDMPAARRMMEELYTRSAEAAPAAPSSRDQWKT